MFFDSWISLFSFLLNFFLLEDLYSQIVNKYGSLLARAERESGGTERERETETETETERQRERERQTDRQTDRQADRDTESQREREREKETGTEADIRTERSSELFIAKAVGHVHLGAT